jgi:ABC-type nitrate/sulfonate/bicarbonate transport system permease component
MDAKNCIRSDALLATMITIGAIGLLLDAIMRGLEKWVATQFGLGVTAGAKKE